MAAGRDGVLTFNPAVAAVAGAKPNLPMGGRGPAVDQSGGGHVTATGDYYSNATIIAEGGWSDFSDVFDITGDLAGTMSAEFSNASDTEILQGTDTWIADTGVTANVAVASAGSFGIKGSRVPYGRMRLKFHCTAGTDGTIRSRRVIKAS